LTPATIQIHRKDHKRKKINQTFFVEKNTRRFFFFFFAEPLTAIHSTTLRTSNKLSNRNKFATNGATRAWRRVRVGAGHRQLWPQRQLVAECSGVPSTGEFVRHPQPATISSGGSIFVIAIVVLLATSSEVIVDDLSGQLS
jgi:hypothetical protein